jgi:hypothetical protein
MAAPIQMKGVYQPSATILPPMTIDEMVMLTRCKAPLCHSAIWPKKDETNLTSCEIH